MTQSITTRIEEKYNTLSIGKQKVANFILDHLNESSYLTLIQMQEKIGVSEATIIRFAYTIGYSGYSEMQSAIRDSIFHSKEKDDVGINSFESIEKDIELIRESAQKISVEVLDQIVRYLHDARNVYIVGRNTSKATAEWFSYVLGIFKPNVMRVQSENLNRYQLDMSEKDVLVTISFPRYHRETFKFFEYAKKQGLTTISVTNNSLSPYFRPSDITILAKTNRDISGYNEIAPVISILNLVFNHYRDLYSEEVRNRIQRLEALNDESDNLIE
ncbi:MurR/RpiR family transcriptional regulator [Staphylococcus coagulans]|uniref:MurR/RpiR family transcriptional regulator n=1 Tax=Staphylococcus coagulans TaxID=74706 RepID=UPI00067A33D2|nr:MurR/RpiR family transcriptional regulator [Staphylococcus coagulans]AKS66025.1 hypothetical protein LH95_00465 [Staphylococcus schleiferi]MBA8774815.1 SIS domain-containing protein [Staphylococcus coagulans]